MTKTATMTTMIEEAEQNTCRIRARLDELGEEPQTQTVIDERERLNDELQDAEDEVRALRSWAKEVL